MSVGVVSYPMLRETRSSFWLVTQDTPGYLFYNMIFNPHPSSAKGVFVYPVFPFLWSTHTLWGSLSETVPHPGMKSADVVSSTEACLLTRRDKQFQLRTARKPCLRCYILSKPQQARAKAENKAVWPLEADWKSSRELMSQCDSYGSLEAGLIFLRALSHFSPKAFNWQNEALSHYRRLFVSLKVYWFIDNSLI